VFVTPVKYSKSDLQWLPSANLRFDLNDSVVLRSAIYRSLFRPNIADIAPRFAVEQNDEDEREGEFGNPDLDPYTAWNVDAGAEWYFADNSVLQAGIFYKKIDDFIVRSVVEDTTFNGIFVNGRGRGPGPGIQLPARAHRTALPVERTAAERQLHLCRQRGRFRFTHDHAARHLGARREPRPRLRERSGEPAAGLGLPGRVPARSLRRR
jgi:hypothetical protein